MMIWVVLWSDGLMHKAFTDEQLAKAYAKDHDFPFIESVPLYTGYNGRYLTPVKGTVADLAHLVDLSVAGGTDYGSP